MQRQSAGIPPELIWTLGLTLLAADTYVSKSWQDVWSAMWTGTSSNTLKTAGSYQVFWRLGGGLLLLWLLALWASASEGGGVFAVTFLVILWVFFLVQHSSGLAAVLGHVQQAG